MTQSISLLTDVPIQSQSEDLFEYKKFTQRLVSCLKEFRSKDGLVVALNGEWGSGKTSVINLIKNELAKDKNLKVISYSYWWYEGKKEVITAFLLGLSEAIGELKNSEKIISTILNFIQPLASVADCCTGTEISSKVLEITKCLFNPVSLEQQFNSIKDFLRKQTSQIVIFIDDLDRMNPDDSIEVYKLLKTIGRLPNVTFVIAYDKAQANRTILQKYPSEGKNFLEKVIQVSFDMPEPSSEKLFKVFQKELRGTLSEHIDQLNLQFYWDKYLRDFIKTPRNLGRLLANIEFNAKPIIADIYLPDFILLEVLRLQFPDIYLEISRNKRAICKDNPFQVTNAEKERIDSEFLKVLLGKCDKRQEVPLGRLLTELLSPLTSVRKVKVQRRFCSNDYFETYFNLNISDDAISEYELKKLISFVKNKDDFINAFGGIDEKKSFIEKKRFAVFLKELSLRPDLIKDQKEAEELLEILADLIDKGHDAESLVRSDDLTDVYQLFVNLWETLNGKFFSEGNNETNLQKLIEHASVNLIAQSLNYSRDIHRTSNFMQVIGSDQLKQALQQKMLVLLTTSSLLSLGNRLRFCLSVYLKNIENNSIVKESLDWMLSNSLSVDKLARCFTTISVNSDGLEQYYAHDDEIAQCIDREKFYKAVNNAASDPKNENAKRFMSVSKYRIDSRGLLAHAFG